MMYVAISQLYYDALDALMELRYQKFNECFFRAVELAVKEFLRILKNRRDLSIITSGDFTGVLELVRTPKNGKNRKALEWYSRGQGTRPWTRRFPQVHQMRN